MDTSRAAGTLVLLGALLLAGCADQPAPPAPDERPRSAYRLPADPDVRAYFRSLRGRTAVAAGMYFSNTLLEHLPDQEYVVDGGSPVRLSAGIVVGTVTDVLPGRAYVLPDGQDDAPSGVPVSFDDPGAYWRVARVRIAVEEWFADGPAPDVVEVGAFVEHPAGEEGDTELAGLAALGDVVVVLDPDRSYPWDPDVVPVARGGALLGDIDTAGHLGFPGLGYEGRRFAGVTTIADLRAAWASDPEPIRVSIDRETGRLTREE